MTETAPPNPSGPVRVQTAPGRGGRRLVRWLVVLGLAFGGYLAWQHYKGGTDSPSAPAGGGRGSAGGNEPQTIRDAEIVTSDVPITLNALGAVTPLATVTIQTQISGQLQKIGFVEGQMVKAGDFLAQIDDRPYQATLAQAQAQLAKDTALHEQAQSDLTRYETLNRQDSIARQQVTDQVFLVQQDAAAMAADQAQIDSAKLNINYCHIVSPVTGRVGLRQVDQGNYVTSSSTTGLVVVTEIEPISVVFSIPEDSLPQVMTRMRAGAELTATAYDRANVTKLSTGKLAAVDSQIDTTTGTVKLRAIFDNKDDILFPQQFVNVQLLVDTMTGAIVTPNAAIQQGVQGSFVYVVNDDSTVSVRNVKTGPVDGERTAILSGLKAGEHVVIDGADRLKEGAKVLVRNDAAATSATDTNTGQQTGSNGKHDKTGTGDASAPDASGTSPSGHKKRDKKEAGSTPDSAPAAQ
ncbi:MdtA/MuxA family multidrug efflux RND transporter periplasmic adaptor subunit [Methylovirgula sp. 4M-Z18]|uniref:MdtA/MuxA family multidrug efflux RND transporter periplasmic adaptor subunit n=1 Tax=Methylovirgula sp. 4M-Z18 TaxID=2293567 RepID=UPI000E2E830B|nr:MdtA/MuxA family multidrug efflux RND transporter periplasmic adaptor subunit [Methylovirgula sp. 4M-Z18]RFB79919.1 MdtA/MuxA family multidrug efflux RND transporter periplasmic adaptor subunit [Methylovirgula sp. 4M-Z18]